MENDTEKQFTKDITECRVMLAEVLKDLQRMDDCKVSKDNYNNLIDRVVKMEGNQTKVVWIVLSAVLGAVLLLVLK